MARGVVSLLAPFRWDDRARSQLLLWTAAGAESP
jgi:hypothetical protein